MLNLFFKKFWLSWKYFFYFQSQELADMIRTALKTFAQSHVATENEEKQIAFLNKVVDHNIEKFLDKIQKNK